MINSKTAETEKQLSDADLLLKNVKSAFQLHKDSIGTREDKLVREIQLLLLNDKT